MDDDQLSRCPECGEVHTGIALLAKFVPAVPGSRMRRGGTYTTESGITIGSGEWRKIRCMFCGREHMTPIEAVPPLSCQASDGAYIGHCASCHEDLEAGFRPGHNPNRRRRRRR